MKVPVTLRLAVITVGFTAFYTYVGQLVPQKEVHPPQVVEIAQDVTPTEMADIGKGIFDGKGLCITCHKIGASGPQRFPDMAGIATRAGTRIPGLSARQYLVQSLYEPDVYIVPGFIKGMPVINKAPIGLTDDEIKTVIAYLESLGGTPTITMDVDLFAEDGGEIGGDAGGDAVAEAGGAEATVLDRFGCTGCHYQDQPGKLQAASLYDIGSRLERDQILLGIIDHPVPESGTLEVDEATVADLQSMVGYLAELKGTT